MFCHWLFSLLICIALSLYAIAPQLAQNCSARLEQSLGHVGVRVVGIILLVIYLALCAFQLLLILDRRRKVDRGFITVESSETGRVRIAVSAIEQLVRQSVRSIDGITGMDIHIENLEDAIGITVNAVIASGSHVPTITMNMQRAIRQFVEVHCGVEVRMVSVSINAVSNQQASPRRHMLGMARMEGKTAGAPQMRETKTDVGSNNVKTGYSVPEEAPVEGEIAPSVPEPLEPVPSAEPVAAAQATPEPVFQERGTAPEEAASGFESNASSAEPEAFQTGVGYDFSKPYESEFTRDLAEMKARASAQTDALPADDGN